MYHLRSFETLSVQKFCRVDDRAASRTAKVLEFELDRMFAKWPQIHYGCTIWSTDPKINLGNPKPESSQLPSGFFELQLKDFSAPVRCHPTSSNWITRFPSNRRRSVAQLTSGVDWRQLSGTVQMKSRDTTNCGSRCKKGPFFHGNVKLTLPCLKNWRIMVGNHHLRVLCRKFRWYKCRNCALWMMFPSICQKMSKALKCQENLPVPRVRVSECVNIWWVYPDMCLIVFSSFCCIPAAANHSHNLSGIWHFWKSLKLSSCSLLWSPQQKKGRAPARGCHQPTTSS